MINLQFENYPFQYKDEIKGRYIFDLIRKKYVLLQPEEWVRQNILHYLIKQMAYPKGLISVEREIRVNQLKKRYDIVVYDKERHPWMLIECKEWGVPITEKALNQLLSYHQVLQCAYWMLSNGNQHYCAQVNNGKVSWLSSLPDYNH